MNASFRCAMLISLLFLTGCVLNAQSAAEGSFQRSLTVSGPVDLDLETGSGHVEVHPGASGRVDVRSTVRVSARRRGRAEAEEVLKQIESNPPIEQTGNEIRIGHIENPDYRRDVSISYEITVPPDTKVRSHTGSGRQTITGIAGPVDANTGSGRIQINDINSNVSANTGSGSIVAEGIGGGFRGTTGSGSVRLRQTAAGNVEVSTGSGRVELSGVKGELRARTGSGRISVDGEPAGRWDLQASSGSVLVRLPAQAAFNLDARSGSGGVTVDHPVTVQGRIRRNELVGTVRGGGFPLDVRTGSGSIRIE